MPGAAILLFLFCSRRGDNLAAPFALQTPRFRLLEAFIVYLVSDNPCIERG